MADLRTAASQRSQAESEYRSAYHQLWNAAKVAQVPEVLSALQRFQQASVKLSVTRPVIETTNGGTAFEVLKGWPMKGALEAAASLPPCPVCGHEVPVKPLSKTGPQRRYCSRKCMKRAIQRRHRDKRRGGPVQPVRVMPTRGRLLTPIVRHSNHVYIVMTAQQLIDRRTRAGWPPDLYARLVMDLPRVVCERCLRSERQIRREERMRERAARQEAAPLGSNGQGTHPNGNGASDAMQRAQVAG